LSEAPSELTEELEKWARAQLGAVVEGLIRVLEAKSKGLIIQKKVADKFLLEFREHQNDTMEAFMLTIRPEFRDFYFDAIDRITKAAVEQYKMALEKAMERG